MKIFEKYKNTYTISMITVATLIQVFTYHAIIKPADLMPGGFLGASVLLEKIVSSVFSINVPVYVWQMLLNVPVAILCYKGISQRFAIFSVMQVVMSSFLMGIIRFSPIIDDPMLSVLLGGALSGLYITIALNGNASTGGTDFIAMYVSNKKGKSIWEYVFVGNCVLLVIFGALSSWEQAGYSILYQFISTKTISAFHHRYDQLTIQVTTEMPEKVMDFYFANYRHGMSCLEAVGGYTHRKTYILFSVISSYELKDVTRDILSVDPKAIINVMRTQQFFGGFYRKAHD